MRASWALLMLLGGCAASQTAGPPKPRPTAPLTLDAHAAACVDASFDKFQSEHAEELAPAECGWTDAERRDFGRYAFALGTWHIIQRPPSFWVDLGRFKAALKTGTKPEIADFSGRVSRAVNEARDRGAQIWRPFHDYVSGARCPSEAVSMRYVKAGERCGWWKQSRNFLDGYLEICMHDQQPEGAAACTEAAAAAWKDVVAEGPWQP